VHKLHRKKITAKNGSALPPLLQSNRQDELQFDAGRSRPACVYSQNLSQFHWIAQYAGQIADQTIPLMKLRPQPTTAEQAMYRILN
jgi:hypothetical protein